MNSIISSTAIPFLGDINKLASQYGCKSASSCCAYTAINMANNTVPIK